MPMSEQSARAERVFGIDLGTTYSAIAYVDETGRPTVCRNSNGAETTPSVVYFESPTNVVVGETAKQSAYIDADNVVKLIKREMGKDLELPFHGEVQTPPSISALILKQLAADAAVYTNGPVNQVVITVPAYFGAAEREATKQAGIIAGLDVVGVLPEPVAAAVHYDLTSGTEDKTVLVYDLGGGTFDTTVIEVKANEIVVVCTDGDTNLGGADWDARLGEHILRRFVEDAKPADEPDDLEFQQEVVTKAEELKKQLSMQESRPVQLRFAGAAAKIEVTRDEFEAMTSDLLDRTVTIVRRTLTAMAEKSQHSRIDEVLLVGGSTRMPMVSARLAAEFDWSPRLHDPDLAVAKGAALFALSRVVHRMLDDPTKTAEQKQDILRREADQRGMSEVMLKQLVEKKTQSVLPKAFGVKLQDPQNPERDYIQHLAFANDTLPTGERTLTAHAVHHLQDRVSIEVYEQAGTVVSEELSANTPLTDGSGLITGIPPQPEGHFARINIVLAIDEDGLLGLRATELSTGKELLIQARVGLSKAELRDAIDSVAKISVSG
jgi:molecular chaperone DnaK